MLPVIVISKELSNVGFARLIPPEDEVVPELTVVVPLSPMNANVTGPPRSSVLPTRVLSGGKETEPLLKMAVSPLPGGPEGDQSDAVEPDPEPPNQVKVFPDHGVSPASL